MKVIETRVTFYNLPITCSNSVDPHRIFSMADTVVVFKGGLRISRQMRFSTL
jgi:hypothetical protein